MRSAELKADSMRLYAREFCSRKACQRSHALRFCPPSMRATESIARWFLPTSSFQLLRHFFVLCPSPRT